MLLALALAAMTAIAVATVVPPLMNGTRPIHERAAFDSVVYRQQLKELERDVVHGLISESQMAAAQLEIERRLLAADRQPAAPPARSGLRRLVAIALPLAMPALAGGLYLALGSPNLPDQPYAARESERTLVAKSQLELVETAAALEEKLTHDSDDPQDWLLLAGARAALGQWGKSTEAYRHAIALTKGRPDVLAGYGEVLVMAAGGFVTPEAREAFDAALARDPRSVAARYYLALDAAQAGRAKIAIDSWQALAAETAAGSPLREDLKARIAETARTANLPVPALAPPPAVSGPTADDMAQAAQMTTEQRQEVIKGMVAGLAARLQAHPDDPEGWLKLAHAYSVLGERDKAVDAYEQAATLRPNDPAIPLRAAESLIAEGAPETPLPERVVALFRRVEAIDPKQPEALWYLGFAAVQRGNFAEAAAYWQRVLAVLPAQSKQYKTVSAALQTLEQQ
jgi:cytochrome c-type biogenesis protein CcmH